MTDLISREAALAALEWGDIYGRNAQDAIRALPAAQVKVKPLVWEPSAIGKSWHSAKAPWGWYYAQWDDETQAWFASLEMGEVEPPIILSPSDVSSIDAAKAAAQADYEARILATLDLSPTAVDASQTPDPVINDPRVKALVEAATGYLDAVASFDGGGGMTHKIARLQAWSVNLNAALRAIGGEA